MEGRREQIALGRALALLPVLRYPQEFGDQCRDRFRRDSLELIAKAHRLPVNLLHLGTELFDRKLVERHNRLIAYSSRSETKLVGNPGRGFADGKKNGPAA